MKIITALTVILSFLLLNLSSASAAPYQVDICGNSQNNPGQFSASNNLLFTSSVVCPTKDKLSGITAATGTGNLAALSTDKAGWTFTAPENTTFTSVDVSRYMFKTGTAWRIGGFTADNNNLTPFDTCSTPDCSVGTFTNTSPMQRFNIGSAKNIFYGITCLTSSCRTAPANNETKQQARVSVYSMKLTIEDPQGPQNITVDKTGLWATNFTDINVSATDESGIKNVSILKDNTEIARYDATCDYTQLVPCPALTNHTLALDTSALPEGSHTYEIKVSDAAGQTTSSSFVLNIDRTAPQAFKTIKINKKKYYGLNTLIPAVILQPEQNTSPVTYMRYNTTKKFENSTKIEIGKPITLPKNGLQKVWIWPEDAAGNQDFNKAKLIKVKYDKDPPLIKANNYDENQPFRLSATAKDNRKISKVFWSYKASETDSWQPLNTQKEGKNYVGLFPYDKLPAGNYDLALTAIDKTGNMTVATTDTTNNPLKAVVYAHQAVKTTIVKAEAGGQLSAFVYDMNGTPRPGISLNIMSRNAGEKQWIVLQTIVSGPDGQITAALPSNNKTQTVKVEPSPAAQYVSANQTVVLKATAKTTIKLSSTTLSLGQTLQISGKIISSPKPRKTKLYVQAFDRGKWIKVATIKTNKKGKWLWKHRFIKSSGTANYSFRVIIPKQKGFPYKQGMSKQVQVIVYGR